MTKMNRGKKGAQAEQNNALKKSEQRLESLTYHFFHCKPLSFTHPGAHVHAQQWGQLGVWCLIAQGHLSHV